MTTGSQASQGVLLVDAANVIGSRPDGWWRDRPGAARSLVERILASVADGGVEPGVVVVLEGKGKGGASEGTSAGVEVVHASGTGDDALVTLAERATADGQLVTLVSADRALGDRVRAVGARVVGPRWLLDRIG